MVVPVALGLDVPNFTKDVSNFMKDVPNFVKDEPRMHPKIGNNLQSISHGFPNEIMDHR